MNKSNFSGVVALDINDYHKDGAISRSALMQFKRAPIFYHYKYLSGEYEDDSDVEIITERNAMQFGNLVHTAILEPHTMDSRYIAWPGLSRATKEGKALWAEVSASLTPGIQVAHTSAMLLAQRMKIAFDAHHLAKDLLADAVIEHSVFWQDPVTKLHLKARPDIWQNGYIADLKTANDASFDAFQRAVYTGGYHIQCAMQHRAIKEALGENIRNFLFIVIEKEPPFAIGIYQLDEESLQLGLSELDTLLDKMADCMRSNEWPSYNANFVGLPRWAINKQQGN